MSKVWSYLQFWKMRRSRKTKDDQKWDAKLDKILAGELLHDEDPLLEINDDVLCAMKYFLEVVGGKPTNLKRICSVDTYIPYSKFKNIVDSFDTHLNKNESFAISLMNRGEKFYQSSNFGTALMCYNLALSYAPPIAKVLSEVYAKRSALFLETDKLPLAWNDIETGLASPKLSKKLKNQLKRQGSICLRKAGDAQSPEPELTNLKHQKYADQVIFKVHGKKNPTIPSAAAFIKIRFTKDKGRHLITTQDLEPGVTVIVEEPYVSVMDNSMEWNMKHCFKCYTRIYRTVPCPGCVFATYCSETCRLKDYENGHKYFCPCSPYIHSCKMEPYYQLALKAICRAGPEYMFNVYPEFKCKTQEKYTKIIPGFDPKSGRYNSDSHYQIMHLITHVKSNNSLNEIALSAVTSAKVLETKSDFFKEIPDGERKGFFIFISYVLLQHSRTFPFNGVELKKPSGICYPELVHAKKSKKGSSNGMSGIFPLCSLINHACEPNIIWEQAKDGRLAVITRQNLKAGDELLFSYSHDYTKYSFEERQNWSWNHYRFKCTCIACVLNWPLYENIPERQPFLCQKCNSKYSGIFLNEFCWLKEKDGKGICNKCGSQFKMATLQKQDMKYLELLSDAYELISNKKLLEARPIVLKCISYFQKNVKSPSRNMIICHNYFGVIYNDIVDL